MTLIDDRPTDLGDTALPPTGVIRTMDHTGDTPTVTWRRDDEVQVAAARAAFDTARRKGHLAYRVDPTDRSKGEVMRTFDPDAQEIILAPPLVGG